MQNQVNIWKFIKHSLSIQGLNFNKLSSIYNCHRQCFTNLKSKPCPKYERILANILETDPWTLWPDRYDSEHNPSRHKKSMKNIFGDL